MEEEKLKKNYQDFKNKNPLSLASTLAPHELWIKKKWGGPRTRKKAFVAKIHIQKVKLKEGSIFIQRQTGMWTQTTRSASCVRSLGPAEPTAETQLRDITARRVVCANEFIAWALWPEIHPHPSPWPTPVPTASQVCVAPLCCSACVLNAFIKQETGDGFLCFSLFKRTS